MLGLQEVFWFALAALVLGFTPGPNMAYCVSRSLCQGKLAGLVSLAGVLLAYGVHVLATALGFTAVLLTAPAAFEAIRLAGAAYLLWLAWRAVRPNSVMALRLRTLQSARASALFGMGFFTNLLNPSAILFYLSLFPQFLRPERGTVIAQTLQLGAVQIAASGLVMGLMVCAVARLQPVVGMARAKWKDLPRYVLGGVFAALSLRLFTMQIA